MAKHKHPAKMVVKEETAKAGKAPFGTDDSLVVGKSRNPGRVICQDELGFYETDERHVNSGLADPHRCGTETWGFPGSRLTDKQAEELEDYPVRCDATEDASAAE